MTVADDAQGHEPPEDRPAGPPRPEDEVRVIERETDHLARTIDHARDAVRRAQLADSMALPGEDYSGFTEGAVRPAAPSARRDESGDRPEDAS